MKIIIQHINKPEQRKVFHFDSDFTDFVYELFKENEPPGTPVPIMGFCEAYNYIKNHCPDWEIV